jgi:hypothetical protein
MGAVAIVAGVAVGCMAVFLAVRPPAMRPLVAIEPQAPSTTESNRIVLVHLSIENRGPVPVQAVGFAPG